MKALDLIPYLRKNARLSLARLSRELGLPCSTTYEWLKQVERTFIVRHTSLIRFSDLGLCQICVFLKVEKERREDIIAYIRRVEGLNRLYSTVGSFDFVAEFIIMDYGAAADFMEFLGKQEGITVCGMHHIISEIEQERFLRKDL
ncbi:hypothetical protein CMO92_04315 [Candidatus Woesearchaeota archaeon]|nr:hypothetical protein [Candidatus Woesearchaeota archaeon]|tara:strand:- start:3281 stop:3715 length:435 start_codon:yes stop_codon:yes gene_type:complete